MKLRTAIVGAIVLLAAWAAPAAAQYPEFLVTPGQLVPGAVASVTGSGCEPHSEVTIHIAPAGGGAQIVLATATTDENGAYTINFTVPSDLAPGTYVVSASCGNGVAGQQIEVVPGGATPPGGTPSRPIPRTGSDLNAIGLVGAGLLTGGGLLLVATRRRRHEAA